jgi:hypothetical protein
MGVVLRKEGEGTDTFDTYDFGLAAALLAKGHELVAMHPDEYNSKRVVFHFVITPAIEQDTQQYWSESKNLKTRLYGMKI